ncbi:MAG: phospholipase D-like domain-containing protein, partial [Candidatus Thorarchaeota archaeon]
MPIIETIRGIIESEKFEDRIADVLKCGLAVLDVDMNPEEINDSVRENTREIIDARARVVRSLVNGLGGILEELEDFTQDWVAYTLVNSFGGVASASLRRFAGLQEHDVGYSIDLDRKNHRYRIILYDNNHQGNGSSALVRDYLHILHTQRHADRSTRYLPTYDYLSVLEENMMQCSQFHQDLNALRMFEQSKASEEPTGFSEMAYVRSFSKDIFDIGKQTWGNLDIRGPDDAWKLQLARRVGKLLDAYHPEMNEDDILRSTGICWNGCPECIDVNGGALASIARGAFIDKYVLDYWFEKGLDETDEYSMASLHDIAKGAMFRKMGLPTRVKIRTDQQILRTVHLPHTVGFNISRTQSLSAREYVARVLVRTSDVLGLEAVDPSDSQYPIPREGFDRLVWFTLLMSSYLDCVGFLASEDKYIDLVFFTATQIPVNRTGLSPSLLETIDYFRKKQDFHEPIETLSDVLNWLANSGFKIRLCIDNETKDNPYTEKLLCGLNLDPNLEVYVTEEVPGRMHQKTLITPLGAVTGSSNLTKGGTDWNVETVHYT